MIDGLLLSKNGGWLASRPKRVMPRALQTVIKRLTSDVRYIYCTDDYFDGISCIEAGCVCEFESIRQKGEDTA